MPQLQRQQNYTLQQYCQEYPCSIQFDRYIINRVHYITIFQNMISRLIFLTFLTFLVSSKTIQVHQCDCSEISSSIECEQGICEWNGGTKVCEAYPKVDCHVIMVHTTCRTQSTCAWLNGKCDYFESCNKYQQTQSQICSEINYKCQKSLSNDQCEDVKPGAKCSEKAATQTECTNGSDGLCVLVEQSDKSLKCQLHTSCEQGSLSKTECIQNGSCVWKESKCQNKKCEDIEDQNSCLFVPDFQISRATICKWESNKCAESDGDHLTEETCFTHSASSHVWRDGKCSECSWTLLLSVLATLLLVL